MIAAREPFGKRAKVSEGRVIPLADFLRVTFLGEEGGGTTTYTWELTRNKTAADATD